MPHPSRPTIRDVAVAAGVSPTTVSHALNGKGVVRQETELRIREVAERIGYRPSAIARGLRSSRLGLIGLIMRPFSTLDSFVPEGVDYFLRIAGAASLTAMEHGYSLMMVDDPTKAGSPVSALAADVYIVTEPFEDDHVLTMLDRERLPFVTLGADPSRPDNFHSIDILAEAQTIEMLSHLTESGGRTLALVTGTDRTEWNFTAQRTYREWCERHGQAPLLMAIPEAEGEQAGDIALDHFFANDAPTRPDAIYCLTGRHASGVAAAAIARGISVPEQLLVAAGSGSVQNLTQRPTVTAFDLRPDLIAQRAVEYAICLVEGKPLPEAMQAPPAVLYVRESTLRSVN
ncbi:LacI family DNA-binding transcriptional regulator [Leucobacter sp. USHLN153]|uniref:LacI family DNA-binding transcriptional regulator n=1 Tax=Leucobacter sp. USHLN153 TaxID=3081268 RepID=UPI00301A64B6